MAGYDDFNVNVWDTLRVERAGKFAKPKHKSVLILFSSFIFVWIFFFVFAFLYFLHLQQKFSLFILLAFCVMYLHVPTTYLEIEKTKNKTNPSKK